ncbi:hypothetical protein GCM10023085_44580 [Actinomadura viridis]|uniref:Ribosomal silencing factor RsfS n=1 Tax=Actinomadura viridis TaxID=58110 RepID=A0A931DLK9_9ACTN|nr:hypothetical protein [Actinomadura viridis]MBG6089821.1 ribosomal silencing factor RsfS [Actinomadura viridis]
MSAYEPVWHAKGAAEVRGLPERAGKALWDTLVAVLRDPWGQTQADRSENDEAFRFALFDLGDGVVHIRIDDQARTVTVHGVTWLG